MHQKWLLLNWFSLNNNEKNLLIWSGDFFITTLSNFIFISMFENFCCIENADLSRYSTIKIGGRARWLVFPKDEQEVVEIFTAANRGGYKPVILGNGSNILFDVDFFDGVVISTRHLDHLERLDEHRVRVGAGVNLFLLNKKLKEMGLGGMEWSFGIPASFGGLVYMNGGAFGSEVKDVLESVMAFDGERIFELKSDELHFSYRNSGLDNLVVLSGVLRLFDKDSEQIEKDMNNFLEQRKKSQPYDMPSLGSVFKRVLIEPGVYPAKLIDTLGLKGVKIGGVEVSPKHAGFFVNTGDGTAKDYAELLRLVEEKVLKNFNIKLEKEVVFLSEKG